jgi:Cu+-exporting ATPase
MDETATTAPPTTATREKGAKLSSIGAGERLELSVGGMTCPHCPPAVENALKSIPGVRNAHVNLANASASIDFDPARAKVVDLLRAIRSLGYSAETAKVRIPIKHMHCSSCVIRIELALQLTPGVVAARANLGTNAVDIEYQPEHTSFAALRRAIESAGHRVAEPKPAKRPEGEEVSPEEAAQREEYRTLMQKFWFAAVVAIPVMGLSYPDLIPGLAGMDAGRKRDAAGRMGASRRVESAGPALVRLAVLHGHVGCPQASLG